MKKSRIKGLSLSKIFYPYPAPTTPWGSGYCWSRSPDLRVILPQRLPGESTRFLIWTMVFLQWQIVVFVCAYRGGGRSRFARDSRLSRLALQHLSCQKSDLMIEYSWTNYYGQGSSKIFFVLLNQSLIFGFFILIEVLTSGLSIFNFLHKCSVFLLDKPISIT